MHKICTNYINKLEYLSLYLYESKFKPTCLERGDRVLFFGAKQAIRITLTCHLYYAIVPGNFIVLIRGGQHSTLVFMKTVASQHAI